MQNGLSRRGALKLGVASAALPLVHIRTAGAAGKLSIGFWDHWVPGANDAMTKLVNRWAEKNKTEVAIDYITSVGNKNLLTLAAEAQAKSGHDIQAYPTWEVLNNAEVLEPMDDVVKRLSAKYGAINPIVDYLSKSKGSYRAVPAISGSQYKPACSRLDVFQKQVGMDLACRWASSATRSTGSAPCSRASAPNSSIRKARSR
jgi:ABC-type glycerol-3-phosphate transport system substrate-binding protein